jgi:hypothetical protein
MPSLNFQARFAASVKTGTKRQSIRIGRKRAWKAGDTLCLFSGLRHPGCKRLGKATLLSATKIRVDGELHEIHLEKTLSNGFRYFAHLSDDEALALARADGFETLDEFFEFFYRTYGRHMYGDLITW